MKKLPTWKIYTSAMFLQTASKGEYPGDKINQHMRNNKKNYPWLFPNTSVTATLRTVPLNKALALLLTPQCVEGVLSF